MASPTARTLQRLRRLGYTCGVVERRLPIPGANVTQDFLGCIDIIGVASRREPRILAIQATTLTNVPARVAKARQEPRLAAWLEVAAFQVWGWHRRGDRWEPKIVALTAGDLEPTVLLAPRRRGKRAKQPELFD